MMAMEVAWVGLGGNVGDPVATLTHAIDVLAAAPGVRLRSRSRLYRTPAWGNEAQPDFVNAVVALDTAQTAPELFALLRATEQRFGRDRSAETRWGPRTLDLDLLMYGQHTLSLPGLDVPHPRMHERAFVLVPLLEIAPDIVLPGRGPARDALLRVDASNIQPLSEDNARP
jgi:2-amino-4-hydroxy-6-hydroxymethyldihydropteridine diphosphokinase